MTRMDSYIRVSRVGDRSGASYISVGEQRRMIAEGAKRYGVELGLEVVEEDVSGAKAATERGLEALLVRAESGQSGGVIVAWQDRLSRGSLKETAEVWERLGKAEARLLAIGDGLDSSAPGAELTFNIRAAVARDQWKRYRQNWQDAKRNAVERGKFIGPTPVGYRKDEQGRLVPDPDTAAFVKAIFAHRSDGHSWAAIARWTRAQGRPMSQSGVAKLVANAVYLGHSKQGEAINPEAHQPLVSRLDFDRANAAQRTSSYKQRTGRTAGATLAQGLAVCASCGFKLQVKTSNRRYLAFECRNPICDGCHISARKLDGELTARIFDLLEAEAEHPVGAMVRVKGSDRSILTNAEAALEAAQYDKQLWIENLDGLKLMGQAAWNSQLAKLVAAVDAARATLEAVMAEHQGMDQVFMLDEAWDSWTMQERRSYLHKLIRRVRVFPAKLNGHPLTPAMRVTVELVDGRPL